MPARSRQAIAAAAPRSAAESDASAPPNFPIGVRTGAARTSGFFFIERIRLSWP
jgi:hypothetical protein